MLRASTLYISLATGALTAALLVAFLRDKDDANLPPPRFAILCGGFQRPWPAEVTSFWPPRAPLRTPSLHVIGIKDTVVAPCRSEELLDAFAAPAVHRHELVGAPRAMGGHVLPWDPPFHQRVASLIRVAL